MKKTILILLLLILTLSLVFLFYPKKEIEHSFYHWENSYKIQNNKDKLYIKVLDIEYTNKLELIKTKFKNNPNHGFVPVVYITNKAMNKATYSELVNRVSKYLNNISYSFEEVQFDCDWTLGSKENYFRFLKKASEQLSDKELSATIRLHQYKYWKKTGVPPVDRGVLMCYNIGEIENINESNSIFSYDLVTQYLKKGMTYPLKSSIALPIYKWALVYRLGQLSSILNNVDVASMENHIVSAKNNRFLVKDNFYINGQFLSTDDEIKFEEVDLKELEQTAKLLSTLSFDKLIYYHLSQSNIEDYDKQKLNQINTLIYK